MKIEFEVDEKSFKELVKQESLQLSKASIREKVREAVTEILDTGTIRKVIEEEITAKEVKKFIFKFLEKNYTELIKQVLNEEINRLKEDAKK